MMPVVGKVGIDVNPASRILFGYLDEMAVVWCMIHGFLLA